MITIYDYLLLPIYLFIFYVIVKRRSLKYEDEELRKIFLIAFGLRMFGSFAYSMTVQYYYGYGDSFTYYMGGNFIIEHIKQDFSNIKLLIASADELQKLYSEENGTIGGVNGYISAESSVMVMKTSAAVSILSFNRYLISALFFGLFSFAGQWKLFRVFNDINKGKNQKLLAWAVLYTPAIWFWGSGLIKEPICLGGLGFIVSILYRAIVKKKIAPLDWVWLALLGYFVYMTKGYIITILAAAVFLTFLFTIFQKTKILLLRVALMGLAIIGLAFSLSLSNFSSQIADIAQESALQIENYQRNYQATQEGDENSRGGFEMAELNPSIGNIILRSPVVILSCLYRPFLWESRSIMILFSSLESALLLFGTLYLLFKTRVLGFFRLIFTDPYIFFCFIISVLFAAVIGFTTFNFGTLVRYKIMLLPFFYFMMVNMYTRITEKKQVQVPV